MSHVSLFCFQSFPSGGDGLRSFDCQLQSSVCNYYTTVVIIRSLLSTDTRSQLLRLPCTCGWSRLVHFWVRMAPLACSCEDQRRRKGEWEERPQWRGGYVYLYTKWWVCVSESRLWTTQLDPVSVNTEAPPLTHTHAHKWQRRKLAHAWHFFFPSPFALLLCLSAPFAVWRFIAFLRLSIS